MHLSPSLFSLKRSNECRSSDCYCRGRGGAARTSVYSQSSMRRSCLRAGLWSLVEPLYYFFDDSVSLRRSHVIGAILFRVWALDRGLVFDRRGYLIA